MNQIKQRQATHKKRKKNVKTKNLSKQGEPYNIRIARERNLRFRRNMQWRV